MKHKLMQLILMVLVITCLWQELGYTDVNALTCLRQRPLSERNTVENWMVVPDKETIPAILKLTRREGQLDGEIGFELYVKNQKNWEQAYAINRKEIISAAEGVTRGKVVIVGATPGLHDLPIDLLAEFNEIVIVDYDVASLRYDRARLEDDGRFRGKRVIYCLADITGKVKAFVDGIDEAYELDNIDQARLTLPLTLDNP